LPTPPETTRADRSSPPTRRRERRRRAAEQQPLRRRPAYRAALEVLDEGLHLWKRADNKARVAVNVLGPFIALLLLVLANSQVFEAVPAGERVALLMAVSAATALGMALFLLAIWTLRPEPMAPFPRSGAPDPEGALGIRGYEGILGMSLDEYQLAWRQVKGQQLVAEVADQAHAVSAANQRKFRNLDRLFRGLQLMMALAVLLALASVAAVALEGRAERVRLKHGVKITVPALRSPAPPPAEAGAHPAPSGS
jgi:hypothetical protein